MTKAMVVARTLPRLTRAQHEILRRRRAAERALRVEKGRSDPEWWLRYYLPHLFPSSFGEHHKRIIADFCEMVGQAEKASRRSGEYVGPDGDDDGDGEDLTEEEWAQIAEAEAGRVAFAAAYACPRESGKSTVIDGLILWCVCNSLRHFVFIVSDIIDQAEEHIATLKAELEDNERVQDDYGELARGGTWQKREAYTANGIRLKAYGTETRMRGSRFGGYRPDLAIVDDAENDEQAATEAGRKKRWDWLTKVLLNALDSDHGVCVMLGTILHNDSMLARATGKDWLISWRKGVYRAMQHIGGKLRALWPQRWPVPKLLEKRKIVGPVAFAAEFQNEPTADETAIVPKWQLDRAKENGRGLRFAEDWEGVLEHLGGRLPLAVFQAWDFGWFSDGAAKAAEKDTNYTVGIAWAVDVNRHVHVLRIRRVRGITAPRTVVLLKEEAALIRPDDEDEEVVFRVGVESVGLQRELYFHGLRRTSDLPVQALNTTKKKRHLQNGVPGISAYFENDQITFPWPTGDDKESSEQRALVEVVCNEVWGYGKEAHDDSVMSLWFLMRLTRAFLARLDARLRSMVPLNDGEEDAGDGDGSGDDNGSSGGNGADSETWNGMTREEQLAMLQRQLSELRGEA